MDFEPPSSKKHIDFTNNMRRWFNTFNTISAHDTVWESIFGAHPGAQVFDQYFSSKIWSHSKILALYVNVKSNAIHAWGWRKLGLRTNSGDLHCQGIDFKSNKVLKLNLRRCFSKFQCSHCLTLSATFACSPLGVEDIPKKVTESRSWWFRSHKLDIFHHCFHIFSTFFRAKTSTLFGWIHPPPEAGQIYGRLYDEAQLRRKRREDLAREAEEKARGRCLVGEKRWKKWAENGETAGFHQDKKWNFMKHGDICTWAT